MICYQMKSETEQLNLRGDKKLILKLQRLADKFNKRSKAAVAIEIIEQYIEFWEQTETAKYAVLKAQKIAVLNETISAKSRTHSSQAMDLEIDKILFSKEKETDESNESDVIEHFSSLDNSYLRKPKDVEKTTEKQIIPVLKEGAGETDRKSK